MCWLIIMSGVSLGMKRKKMCRQMTHLFSLRKERDSNQGFEPSVRLPVQRFSRPSRSATPASFLF